MLLNKLQTKRDQKANLFALVVLLCFFFATSAYAADSVSVTNAGDMLKRIVGQFPALTRLVTAFAYVAGFFFIFAAIVKMKHLGESRTMMSREHGIVGPLMYLFVGAALVYLPSTVRVGMSTFWAEPNPYGYEATGGELEGVISACFMAVQLFGIIAFIRGMIMLSSMGGQGHQGSMGKAMSHIFGGIFCINIYQFVKVVLATIGVTITGFNS